MIKVQNLTKKFTYGENELVALKGLTFEVPTGQFLSLTGKSGAGKSTTLYQISLLDKPTSGKIIIDDVDVENLSENERVVFRRDNFGFIFQDYALLPSLTAIENVMLPMLMQGLEKSEAEKKAKDALSRVELADKLYNLPSQLSGGQQQRVSIARSIVHKPKILFADEPTANLDSESSEKILDIFLSLNKEEKLTVIMVTHELDYAKLADRSLILKDGEIISDKNTHKKKK